MKRNYSVLVLLVLFAFGSCSFTSKVDNDPNKDRLLIQIITMALEQLHYEPKDINDDFSKEIYSDYLQAVDPFKRYFVEDDIKEFKKFDLKQRWRKQLKYTVLSNYDDLLEQKETENKEDFDAENATDVKTMSLKELEAKARKETLNSLDSYFNDYLEDMSREDWFSMYVNVIVEEFDPHTSYLAPIDKEKFDQQMSGKLEGIGARLQKKSDNIKIVELISGGPAWRGQELEVEDVILKVRQEKEELAVSIVGMRIDDAIKLIKGPKGTKVILTVRKVDGTIEDIIIIRDIVELEETYAKSSIVEKANQKYGIIHLPQFYVDFNDYKKRNAASDIRQEIERLKEQNIEGLVLDLRNNGGGSLKTVVDMAGLFIKEGPIVQVRSAGEPQEVLEDTDDSIVWDGPLVIMVNELSASASEILAAAMQDYKRAIIIGSQQTYGKGTVQNVLDLNRMVRNNSHNDLGALKLTRQKFYRINGGSTQLKGVTSDVVVPDRYSFIDIGERDQENPLAWDKIEPAKYNEWNGSFDYDKTIASSKQRMRENQQLRLIEQNAKWAKTKMDKKVYSLNYAKYKAELDQNEKEAKQFDSISKYKTDLVFNSLPYEKALFTQDTVLKEKRDRWHKNLTKDVYVEEAIHVLQDLKTTYEIKKVATIKD